MSGEHSELGSAVRAAENRSLEQRVTELERRVAHTTVQGTDWEASALVEGMRDAAEADRHEAELGRSESENAREGAEVKRASMEEARMIAEEARYIAEQARRTAEEARRLAELRAKENDALRGRLDELERAYRRQAQD